MAMNERYNIQNQVEHLQMKYVGTGHSEINKWEWGTNI
jgi:splicing factor 3B subunit 5